LQIAERLEALGWRAHFFITTAHIGTPGFLSRKQIRLLHERGHVIGAHSHTHPYRISELPDAQLDEEWRRSTAILADIVGEPVITASVPGGFFAPRVARAAAAAGIRALCTSEPTTQLCTMHDCLIVGRFTIYRGVTPATAAALAGGARLPVLRQQMLWAGKKALKTFAAPVWDSLRRLMLRRSAAGDRPKKWLRRRTL
jgi:peptidoglycan/xylan/chitin deacetylase (PgdA/CDA1 family)